MSACSVLERISMIENVKTMDNFGSPKQLSSSLASSIAPDGPGPGSGPGGGTNVLSSIDDNASLNVYNQTVTPLEKDYYGCYCLKFIVKNGTHITEEKVQQDFGQFGEVVDVRGPGLFSGLRGNHVYVRFIDKSDAEEALRQLSGKYHQLTPASISDVLPDNYGLYTISFYNKTGIPSTDVRKEFSKFGEVKNLTGSLDVKGGRVFVSYKDKYSAVQALQAFFFRKDKYPNMKFALPRCEKDYFGCYCLKFYNKSGDVTEEKVLRDFGQFGEVVDVRGPGLFDVTGDDVYVRYKEKSSAEQALIELVGRYDSLCLAPPSDIQADKFGYFTITFVNDKCLSKSDVWYIFSKFGTVACVNGTFDCKKGRVFVSYKEKQGALNALENMLITKEYHLQVSKNSTVRKNDFNVVNSSVNAKDANDAPGSQNDFSDFSQPPSRNGASSLEKSPSSSALPNLNNMNGSTGSMPLTSNPTNLPSNPLGSAQQTQQSPLLAAIPAASSDRFQKSQVSPGTALPFTGNGLSSTNISAVLPSTLLSGDTVARQSQQNAHLTSVNMNGNKNGILKFNRNVEKDIFGYYCLSFLNEDGDINEKKVRHDFGKFGEVVSVRGALGKQKGHVFVRFRRKEAAENCLNCLNSFPLSEMSELFGKYLFLSPATPRDIDCDMYGLYSISFLNLTMKTFREIRNEFSKFGEIVRLTSGGGGNTDELVSISYTDKYAAVRALQTHFTNKEYPYLDIAKGSSLLLVNSSDSSDNEDNESDYIHHYQRELQRTHQMLQQQQQHQMSRMKNSNSGKTMDPFHDPVPVNTGFGGSDVVDELLKPFQSYFNIYRTGQYQSLHPDRVNDGSSYGQQSGLPSFSTGQQPGSSQSTLPVANAPSSVALRSPDKKYRIKSIKPNQQTMSSTQPLNGKRHHPLENGNVAPNNSFSMPPPSVVPNSNMSGSSRTTEISISDQSSTQSNIFSHSLPLAANAFQEDSKSSAALPSTFEKSSRGATTSSPLSSSPVTTSAFSSYTSSMQPSPDREYQANNSIPSASCNGQENDDMKEEEENAADFDASNQDEECQVKKTIEIQEDILGLYSLCFSNKIKDLNERKIRQDFGTEKVVRIRGLAGLSKNDIGNGEMVIVSFDNAEVANEVANDEALQTKYPGISSAPRMSVTKDREGYYSIEFINSGMSGIREITTIFSKYGEVVSVITAGGAKNAAKKVTVSYANEKSAFDAVLAHSSSKDFLSIDIARECLVMEDDNNGQVS